MVAASQGGVVSRHQAVKCGLSNIDVDTRLRRGEFRSLWPNVLLVDADLFDELTWLTQAHAALLLHGPTAVLALGAAARVLGIAGADTNPSIVEVVLPPGSERHQSPGIELHFWDVNPQDLVKVDGLVATSPTRTLADLALTVPRNRAVAAMDSALNKGLLTPADLVRAQQLTRKRRNCVLADEWWKLADGRAESPLETWCRLDCADAGVAPDELQWNVVDQYGTFIGRGDMAWRKRKRPLVGEADGVDPHSQPAALFSVTLNVPAAL